MNVIYAQYHLVLHSMYYETCAVPEFRVAILSFRGDEAATVNKALQTMSTGLEGETPQALAKKMVVFHNTLAQQIKDLIGECVVLWDLIPHPNEYVTKFCPDSNGTPCNPYLVGPLSPDEMREVNAHLMLELSKPTWFDD